MLPKPPVSCCQSSWNARTLSLPSPMKVPAYIEANAVWGLSFSWFLFVAPFCEVQFVVFMFSIFVCLGERFLYTRVLGFCFGMVFFLYIWLWYWYASRFSIYTKMLWCQTCFILCFSSSFSLACVCHEKLPLLLFVCLFFSRSFTLLPFSPIPPHMSSLRRCFAIRSNSLFSLLFSRTWILIFSHSLHKRLVIITRSNTWTSFSSPTTHNYLIFPSHFS